MSNNPQQWHVFLCDDEPLVLDRLQELCQQTLLPQFSAVFHCAAGPDALPDPGIPLHIAVLDVELKQDSGISLARTILKNSPDCQIIFVSGYPRYVSDVYDVPHLGMILKEQLETRLPKFLLRAAANLGSTQEQTLTVLSNRVPLKILLSSILYLERKDHITSIHLFSGHTIRTRQKLSEILAQPETDTLCRCHVSYAVNLRHVKAHNVRRFCLVNNEQIPISRIYAQTARTAYYAYLQRTYHDVF